MSKHGGKRTHIKPKDKTSIPVAKKPVGTRKKKGR